MNETVQRRLEVEGCDFTVHRHQALISAQDFKTHLPFDPEAMVKTLVFRLPDGGYALAVLRAFARLDYKKLADALGVRRADLRAAEPDDVAHDLGFDIGGVCPITDLAAAKVLIDPNVGDLGKVYCGTGRNTSTLEIAAEDLIRISGGALATISK